MEKITIFGWKAEQGGIDETLHHGTFEGEIICSIHTKQTMDHHVRTPDFSKFRGQVYFRTREYTDNFWFLTFENAKKAQIEYIKNKIKEHQNQIKYFKFEMNNIKKLEAPIA